jgi:hypothetical protein
MTDERYMSWFRGVVEMGWVCGLYHPQEILCNYLRTFYQLASFDEELPFDHIERFMIDVTQGDFMLGDSEKPTLAQAVEHFNKFYAHREMGMDFGVYVRMGTN